METVEAAIAAAATVVVVGGGVIEVGGSLVLGVSKPGEHLDGDLGDKGDLGSA